MTDVTLTDVGTGYDLKTTINDNNDKLEEALGKTLNRDGSDSNSLSTDIDMNGAHRVTNAANAVSNQDYVTLSQAAALVVVDQVALSNTNVGGVLYPQTTAEDNADIDAGTNKGDIKNIYYPPGDVRRYGALAGESASQHLAFQAALDQNNDVAIDSAAVYSPPGDFRIDTGLTWCVPGSGKDVNDCQWLGQGTTLTTSVTSINVLTIGNVTGNDEAKRVKFTGVHFYYTPATESGGAEHDDGKAALILGALYSSIIEAGAQWFHVGLKLVGSSGTSGCVYNEIHLGTYMNNYSGVWLAPTGDGWVNENTFYGGRFGGGRITIGAHIYMPDSGSSHGQPNNNRFMGPSLEGGSGTDTSALNMYYDDGLYNFLFWPRNENIYDTIRGEADIEFGPKSTLGGLFGGRAVTINEGGTGNNTVIDRGIRNTIYAMDGIHGTQSRSGGGGPVIRWFRDRPATKPEAMVKIGDFYTGSGDAQMYLSSIVRSTETDAYHFKGEDVGSVRANTDGVFFHCIKTHTGADADKEPGKGDDWLEYWECVNSDYLAGFQWDTTGTSPTRKWQVGQDYGYSNNGSSYPIAGSRVTHEGICYKLIEDPDTINSGIAAEATEPGTSGGNALWGIELDISWKLGEDYTQPVTQIELHGNGQIWTNQITADTTGAPLTVTLGTQTTTAQNVTSAKLNTTHKIPIYNEAGALQGYIPVVADF